MEEGKKGGGDREKLFTTEIIAELKINESEPDGKNRGECRNQTLQEKNESIRLYPEDMKLGEYSLNAILRSQLRIKWRSGHLIFDPQKNDP